MVADHQGGEHQVGIINRRERRETSPPHILASGSAGTAALAVVPHIAGAQIYPSRPVRISSEIPRGARPTSLHA